MTEDIAKVLSGEREWCVINRDCLEVLPTLLEGCVDAVVTDPVWPNATADLIGSDDPFGLFSRAAAYFPRLAKRAVVHLGCDSDPRFLMGVPDEMPFFRICWLDYSIPSYKGRVLYLSDVAYVFGQPPPARPGGQLIPGRCPPNGMSGKPKEHPCARQMHHVEWLVRWFARGLVLDPFCGIGTTGVACLRLGVPFVGIEIDPAYCDIARRRLEVAEADQRNSLFPARESGTQQRTFTDMLEAQEESRS